MMPRPLRDAMLAGTQLTIVRLPVDWPGDERPDVAGWYPVVGVLLGLAAWGVLCLARWTDASLLASALAIGTLALLTGGLHWDGLADVADAWHFTDVGRRHEVLKDSATGAFGTLAITMAALVQVAAVSTLAEKGVSWAIIIAVVSGRLAATFSAWLGRPARTEGLGAAVCRRPGISGTVGITIAALVLVALWLVGFFSAGDPVLLLGWSTGILLALVVPHLVSGRFNGVSGDTIGASVVIVESIVMVACAVVAAW